MELEEHIARSGELESPASAHPEEIRANVNLRIGERTVLTASARTTPAGLLSVGIMVAAILLSTAALVQTGRSSRYL